jgi:molecular chaperone Hsp33
MLLSLGHQEVEESTDEAGGLYVDCEFCNKRYCFDRLELEQLFDSLSAAPPTPSRH